MGSKACILCDAHPPPALTGEHIWPDWYNKLQPDFEYELEAKIDKAPVEVRRTKDMNLKPKVLCDPCNTQWGSSLENRVSPILIPMMRGEAQRLGRDETQLVSAWFYLKAMVSEYLIPAGVRDRRFHELEQGRYLRATLHPPDSSHIWIGRYVGSRASAGWVTDRARWRRVSDDPPAGIFWRSVVYTIGQVLLHLFAVSRPIPIGEVKEGHIEYEIPFAPADWDSALMRIWEPQPSVAVDWPPKDAFDDAAAIYLVERGNVQESQSSEPPPEIAEAEPTGT
jgi:hypothetical protein